MSKSNLFILGRVITGPGGIELGEKVIQLWSIEKLSSILPLIPKERSAFIQDWVSMQAPCQLFHRGFTFGICLT